ncbi:replicative DNA helicase [Parabacteroides gordonii]|uniref:DNA 5'-3' helicase n=1 Tax=Parabacteroides gordonii MS-1 = DSM 23371 TaxID=1203610 RepID=A0A0F5IUH2_9BACT|nr:DnaB-like helicase C-terminal domain-containing protein [Parabacteroides gordonii]KKB49196.1 replicative DNA helicase [Parabacteroides gordonii MS-1 = DSM 23371]MCA5585467.1 AAA family ATPase [Parabacteroides gordonii]RGP16764.1 DNA helicase [Parabacteroides gordonii]
MKTTQNTKREIIPNINLAMEQAVIAGLLTSPDAIFDVIGRLKADMFSDQRISFVYRAILSLVESGTGVDMLTVENEMLRLDSSLYMQLNGLSFLTEMLLDVRTDSHIRIHADELVRCYTLRQLVNGLKEKETEAQLPSADLPELLTGVEDLAGRLRNGMARSVSMEEAGSVARRVLEKSFQEQADREAGKITRILFGLYDLDALTGGLYKGELTVIAGRPSMGKSAVALWMALSMAKKGIPVVFFSVEMSKEQNVIRLLSMISGIDADRLRFKGTLASDRLRLEQAQQELERLPITLEYCGSDTIDDIRAKAQVLNKQGKLGALFIDYLNLINIVVSKNQLQETTDLALGSIARKTKLMAEEMEIPVILLAQLNREVDRRQGLHFPVLSDLRNSGAIEQVADVVIFVYRAEKYNIFYDPKTKEDLRGVGLLLLAKNRNGATGIAKFRYNPAMTCLTDYDPRVI